VLSKVHRFLAFSIFAFIEYWVAAANMAFYWTVGTDMPDEEIIVVRPALNAKKSDHLDYDGSRESSTGMESSSRVKLFFIDSTYFN